MTGKTALLGGAVFIALCAAGCTKTPKGQILAIVNGEEISLQELNAELQGVSIPAGADRDQIRRQVLQRLIDRKLIVQRAREEGLDKSPDYVTQQRRLDENLLVSLLGQKIAATVPLPEDGDVQRYIASNPSQFGGRERLVLDQIQFTPPKDPRKLLALKDAHSLEAVAAGLDRLGLAYTRAKGVIDTARLDPQIVKTVKALPPGEPFVLPADGQFIASVIVSREASPTPPAIGRSVAAEMVRRKDLAAESRAQVARARSTAQIEYQQGYEPIPPAKPKS